MKKFSNIDFRQLLVGSEMFLWIYFVAIIKIIKTAFFLKKYCYLNMLYSKNMYVNLPSPFVLFSAEVIRSFSHQCRNDQEIAKMWEACKISIGKRCQNLRKNEKSREV